MSRQLRIAYIAHVHGGSRSGVFHKIAGQIAQWRARGHEVLPCVLTRDVAEEWRAVIGDSLVRPYGGFLSRLEAVADLVAAAKRHRPDILYVRWDLFYPPMIRLAGGAPLVLEVNTDDVKEYRMGTKRRSLYNAGTRSILMARAQGMVFVTGELARSRSFRVARGVRRVITNGIDLDAYPHLPAPASRRPRLVFVGTAGQAWHGIDKLVMLARHRPDWEFDVIGSHAPGEGAPPNVTWHGPLDRHHVLSVLKRADIGVGTLALHRKGLEEACPLKLREYLAVGLPVMYAHQDRDIDGRIAASIRLPNNQANVIEQLPRIDEFVRRSRGTRVPRLEVAHIDVARKEEQRLELFDELARS